MTGSVETLYFTIKVNYR